MRVLLYVAMQCGGLGSNIAEPVLFFLVVSDYIKQKTVLIQIYFQDLSQMRCLSHTVQHRTNVLLASPRDAAACFPRDDSGLLERLPDLQNCHRGDRKFNVLVRKKDVVCYLPSFSKIGIAEKLTAGKDALARTTRSWASSDRLAQINTKHSRVSLVVFSWDSSDPNTYHLDILWT